MFKPEDFGFMGEEFVNQLKFHEGLQRLLRICTGVHEYDWKWFADNLSKNKSPITSQENFKTTLDIAAVLEKLTPLVSKMSEIGQEIGDRAKKANLN